MMALKMLISNPFELLAEMASVAIAKVVRWDPSRKRVLLGVPEGEGPRQSSEGYIVDTFSVPYRGTSRKHVSSVFVRIQLESPIVINGETLDHLVAGPRYYFHSVRRLILGRWTANLYRVTDSTTERRDEWMPGRPDAIGFLRLSRPKVENNPAR